METIKAIVQNNILRAKELITPENVNDVLDKKSNYIALHYAIEFKRNEIISYLFSLGTSVYAKTSSGEISFDLAVKNQYKYFFSMIDKARLYSLHLNIKYEKEIINLKNIIETSMSNISNLHHISNGFKNIKVPEGLPCKIHGFNCSNINIQNQNVSSEQCVQLPVQLPVQRSSQNMILQIIPKTNLVSLPMKIPLESNNGISSNVQNDSVREQSSHEQKESSSGKPEYRKQPPKQSSFTALDRLISQLSNDISYIEQEKSSSSSSSMPTIVHPKKRGRKSKKEENVEKSIIDSNYENDNNENKKSKDK
jgi:hypothetical protein